MQLNQIFLITTIIGFPFLQSCANLSGPTVPKISTILKEQSGQDGRACIRENSIQGWGSKGDAIFVNTSNKYYLVTTLLRCHSLDTSARVAFVGRINSVCGGRQDKIVTSDDKCIIQNIFEYEDKSAARASLQAALDTREELKEAAKTQDI